MKVGKYDLVCTCDSHPEQYDVMLNDKQVGFLRLRHGEFRADVPDVGGETIYTAEPNGDGNFDDDERDRFLLEAIEAIDRHYAK